MIRVYPCITSKLAMNVSTKNGMKILVAVSKYCFTFPSLYSWYSLCSSGLDGLRLKNEYTNTSENMRMDTQKSNI